MAMGAIGRVGIAGLGRMGLRIARRLAAAGFETAAFDPAVDAAASGRAAGIAIVGDAAALAARSDLLIVAVGFEAEVDAVLFGAGGAAPAAAPGTVVAIAATVEPAYVRALPARLADLAILDIPLARGEMAAERGELLMFAGGDAETLARCRPAFDTFASEIHLLGPLGAGQVAKAANNFLLWANVAATVEAYAFAEAGGVRREALRTALLRSSGANWAMETRAEEREALWAEKDMTALLAEADRVRVALPVAGVVREAIKAHKIARNLPMPGGA